MADRGGAAVQRRAPSRSFRMPEVVLGVLLVTGSALGAVLWQRSATETETVVVAARPIERGSVVGAADLRGVEIGGQTSGMVHGGQAASLIGRVAVVDIGNGVPLTPTLLSDEPALETGDALVSLAMADGHLPPDLAPGDLLRLIVTPPADESGLSVTHMLDPVATVWAVDLAGDGSSTILTIRCPLEVATPLAAASQVAAVRVAAP